MIVNNRFEESITGRETRRNNARTVKMLKGSSPMNGTWVKIGNHKTTSFVHIDICMSFENKAVSLFLILLWITKTGFRETKMNQRYSRDATHYKFNAGLPQSKQKHFFSPLSCHTYLITFSSLRFLWTWYQLQCTPDVIISCLPCLLTFLHAGFVSFCRLHITWIKVYRLENIPYITIIISVKDFEDDWVFPRLIHR